MRFSKNPVFIALASVFLLSSCGEDNNKEQPVNTPKDIAKTIVGNWLLSSSTSGEWAIYEFTETARVSAKYLENGKVKTGRGFYWINEDKSTLTGNIVPDLVLATDRYLDWVIDDVKPFEISFKNYNNNQFAGNLSIYRIICTEMAEAGNTFSLNFRAICGTDNVTDLKVINNEIATVNEDGKINALKNGETYIVFNTVNGHGVVRLEITKPKTFAELVVGTWIYDKLSEKEWQRTIYDAKGFVSIEWADPQSYNTINTTSGTYQLSGNDCLLNLDFFGIGLKQQWKTELITEMIWTYYCYAEGNLNGKYTGQRLLGTVTLKPGETYTPDYAIISLGFDVEGYESKNPKIATVSSSGKIEALSAGRTYIDVKTYKGAGVFEVYVK